ncbi:prepilin-type N-terminal cleavage/methylation domain-containing protein [Tepidibacillus marianensis]|uniref:type II secretion system protein n=1 Tax=Tepidibacillus marianensis TaxID=3131995 RepID=UPI0030CFF9E9
MNKLLRKQVSNQRGVTLIELLAVIVIIGIIAAVAVPAVLSQIDSSRIASDTSNIAIINDALQRYYANNGTYPTGDFSAMLTTLKANGNGGPYIKDFPSTPQQKDKSWNYDATTGTASIL